MNIIIIFAIAIIIAIAYSFFFKEKQNIKEGFVNFLVGSNDEEGIIEEFEFEGMKYKIQGGFDDKREAAALLSKVLRNGENFVQYMMRTLPNDQRVINLRRRYNTRKIQEGTPFNSSGSTAYSLNKGEKLILCLRSKKTGKLHDENLIMFVLIHEMSHLAGDKYDNHGEEFNANFGFLLKHAISAGFWQKIHFDRDEREYCGLNVKSMPAI